MRLDDIRKLVTESKPEDWNQMTVGGTAAPSYKQTLVTHKVNDELVTVVEEHTYVAVYKEDVDLSIAWGLEENGYYGDKTPYVFPLTENFANSDVRKFTLDVFWAGNLVDRHTMLSVDGSRAYLPLSQLRIVENGSSEEYFPADEVAYARLIHGLNNKDGFDDYLTLSKTPVLTREEANK